MVNYDIIVYADLIDEATGELFLAQHKSVWRRIENVRRRGNVVLDISMDKRLPDNIVTEYILLHNPPKGSTFTLYGTGIDVAIAEVASAITDLGYECIIDERNVV